MKRILLIAIALVVSLGMAGCMTKPNAAIKDGQVSGLRSHEVTTLVKQDVRKAKVKEVQMNYKPIFKVVGIKGQTISFSGVESLEINVPLDINTLLAEQADSESEGVQVFKQAVSFGTNVVKPLAIAAVVSSTLKAQSNDAKEVALAQSGERAAQTEAMADLAESGMDYASKPPLVVHAPAPTIVQVPLGSSVLATPTAPVAAAE